MKKIALVLLVTVSTLVNAQVVQQNAQPQISVSGEGRVTITPDQAVITIGVENIGADAAEVKRKNDASVDAVVKYLKSINLPAEDYQTQRVYLNRNYDYDKKKYNYVASQTMVIKLKDLSKYETMMLGLIDAGVNNIQGVEFRTSKLAQYEAEARVKAVQNARQKASDYASALGQKAGGALLVTDNSAGYYPPVPVMRNQMRLESADGAAAGSIETLAVGEVVIIANVTVIFELK